MSTSKQESQQFVSATSVDQVGATVKEAATKGGTMVTGRMLRRPPLAEDVNVTVCDLSALNSVLEHSVPDQVIEVETGIKIAELNTMLARHKQFLPVRVPADWTLLDVLNSGQCGTLEHGYGGMRQLLLGTTAMLADGTLVHTGGKVVKNVTGYDVSKLLIGSQSSLAVPLAAHLRLYALPETSLTLIWSFSSLWHLMNGALKLMRSDLPLSALEITASEYLQQGKERWVLAAKVAALHTVAEEIAHAAIGLVGEPDAQLQGSEEEQVWDALTTPVLSAPVEQALKVVAPPTAIPDIVSHLAGAVRWQARPLKGSISAVCRNVAETVEVLRQLAAASDQPLTVAFADNSYNYRVSELPKDDPAKAQLKSRINQALDPAGTLNRFAFI